ncbi:HypC/HybG/HupF family hydrogenase formation chaperone [Streptomyces sp. VRA16 Mangrove soil]|uniref:HypC/HybG/HupF family hydrogenase formation chaperone n=1 Tax=Streptomyces sp. VRA16 Mangrove soil TaxID=2817434 RepID=UPI001A9EDA6A|nr:HypC/HybG/HupF family hydrogenase formation chaperone [Streptomyces sp. VRA16 Mangrove soil]MBO1334416.1 HypC/HybG/HupF family hydrogenase formation chaperone [Streptomyces sp. VRA16 Mangrove soil]
MCLGIPGRITEVHDSGGLRMATVDFGGVRREVCLEYTPDAAEGTYVVVHVGFAITTVDEAEARRTLDVLRAMADAVESELGEPLPPGPDGKPAGPPGPAPVPGQPLTAGGRPPDAG